MLGSLRWSTALILALPLLNTSVSSTREAAAAAPALQVSIDVPPHLYPRNALERFTIHVRNVSQHAVLTQFGRVCWQRNPSVDVADSSGNLTPQFPPDGMPMTCPVPIGRPFRAGGSWTGRAFAIMNGISVRADLMVGKHLNGRVVSPYTAIGIPDDGTPKVIIHQSTRGAYVVLPRPPGATGPLYMVGSTMCSHLMGGANVVSTMDWTALPGDRVYSGCTGPQQWYAYAGYLGFPVASIHYTP